MSEPWVTYDSRANALTVVLDDAHSARTVEESESRLVDLDASGKPVAVEVLGVSHGFRLDDLAAKYGLEDELRAVEGALPAQFYRQHV